MDVIHTYTADDAINDGLIVNTNTLVPEEDLARQAGFLFVVRITNGVLALVEVPDKLKSSQDLKGRLWDLLWMASLAFRKEKARAKAEERAMESIVPFKCLFAMGPDGNLVEHEIWCGFDFTAGEAIHLYLPSEH